MAQTSKIKVKIATGACIILTLIITQHIETPSTTPCGGLNANLMSNTFLDQASEVARGYESTGLQQFVDDLADVGVSVSMDISQEGINTDTRTISIGSFENSTATLYNVELSDADQVSIAQTQGRLYAAALFIQNNTLASIDYEAILQIRRSLESWAGAVTVADIGLVTERVTLAAGASQSLNFDVAGYLVQKGDILNLRVNAPSATGSSLYISSAQILTTNQGILVPAIRN